MTGRNYRDGDTPCVATLHQEYPICAANIEMEFADLNTGYAVGMFDHKNTVLRKSVDGGSSWVDIETAQIQAMQHVTMHKKLLSGNSEDPVQAILNTLKSVKSTETVDDTGVGLN